MATLLDSRFELGEIIGQGRVSTVYRAKDTLQDKTIAVKIFSPLFIPGPKTSAYLLAEIRKRLGITHPNLINMIYCGEYLTAGRNTVYCALDYVSPVTLASRLNTPNPKPRTFASLLQLLQQVTSALSTLHEHHLAANYLDPRRLLLTEDGSIKIPSFGFATLDQWIRDHSRITHFATANYRYLAPETIVEGGIRAGDPMADIYLFGILAFELATGVVPFEADRQTTLHLHRTEPMPDTLRHCGLPDWFEKLIRHCLNKSPNARPSIDQVAEQIAAGLNGDEEELHREIISVRQSSLRVLFIEDNKLDQLSLARIAKAERFPFRYSLTAAVDSARDLLQHRRFDVIVSDFLLSDGTAMDIFRENKNIPMIIVTSCEKRELAIDALTAGVFALLTKDSRHQHLKALPYLVTKAFEVARSEKELRELRALDKREEFLRAQRGDF